MREYLLNHQQKAVDFRVKSWGDLLDVLDDQCAEGLTTVTAVRFGGVDQPSFRATNLALQPLAVLGCIEIETSDRTRLLLGTLGTATQSLPGLAAAACRTANAFRGSDMVAANAQLTAMVEAIRTLTMLTAASATAAGTTLEDLPCGANRATDVLAAVGVVLDTLAQWQQGHDWIAVADALEYDLAPALLEWGAIFDAMHERCAA